MKENGDYVRSIIFIFAIVVIVGSCAICFAHDDGRYAQSNLKGWFDKLASGKGLCCSFADGVRLDDPEWGTHDDHYWVILSDGQKYAVPADALITEPNKAKVAVVWPFKDAQGIMQIRCFLPGAGG